MRKLKAHKKFVGLQYSQLSVSLYAGRFIRIQFDLREADKLTFACDNKVGPLD